jgi:transposase
MACWKQLDPAASKNRGLLSLMRRHRHNLSAAQQDRPGDYLGQSRAVEVIYLFKQRLYCLLLEKAQNQKRCRRLAHRFLRQVAALRCGGFAPLAQLGNTPYSWRQEIAAMWRFSRNNGITEGFHTKMEPLSAKPMASEIFRIIG